MGIFLCQNTVFWGGKIDGQDKLLKESRKQRAEIVEEKMHISLTQMEALTSNSLKSRQLK